MTSLSTTTSFAFVLRRNNILLTLIFNELNNTEYELNNLQLRTATNNTIYTNTIIIIHNSCHVERIIIIIQLSHHATTLMTWHLRPNQGLHTDSTVLEDSLLNTTFNLLSQEYSINYHSRGLSQSTYEFSTVDYGVTPQ